MALATIFPWDEISAFATEHYIPKAIDQIYKSNILLAKLKERGNVEVRGGTEIRQPIEFAKGGGGNYDGKYDIVTTTHVKTHDYAVVDWKHKYAYSDITKRDRVMANGPEAILSLVESRVKGMGKKLSDLIGTGIYSSGGTEQIDGLQLIVDTGNSYAGIAQGTYTYWAAAGESSESEITDPLLSAAIGTVYDNCKEKPDFGVCTQAIFNFIRNLYQPQQRYQGGLDQANVGYGTMSLMVNGVPIVPDNKCPASHLFLLNLDHLFFITSEKDNFDFTGWEKPINQPGASIAFTTWSGNLMCDSPRTTFRFKSISS